MKIRLSLSLFIVLTFNQINAQFNVSFLTNSDNSLVGIGYSFNEKLTTDLRVYSSTDVSGTTIQALLRYNFVRKEDYAVYIGGGLIMNQINAFAFPLGVDFKPIKSQPKLSLFIELQPYYEFDATEFFITGFGGLRFRFK